MKLRNWLRSSLSFADNSASVVDLLRRTMASSSFVPKGQKGLLLRSPLTIDFSPPSDTRQPKPIYSRVSKNI